MTQQKLTMLDIMTLYKKLIQLDVCNTLVFVVGSKLYHYFFNAMPTTSLSRFYERNPTMTILMPCCFVLSLLGNTNAFKIDVASILTLRYHQLCFYRIIRILFPV